MEEAARKIRAPVQILAEEAGHGLLFRAGMLPVSPDEDQLEEALRAAREGRVEVLLLEEGRVYPEGEEALDELVRLVLGKQGEVFFLPGAELEMKAGLAAIFRF